MNFTNGRDRATIPAVRKAYLQYCPVAHALDLVGERWALLIVRDLLKGPKRYTDLLDALPGIGTNILASRLRDLEQGGVVKKTKLPPPTPATVYELTEYGAELEEVVHALGRWGARSIGPPGPEECLSTGWLANAMRTTFDPIAARDVEATYEVRADGEVATTIVRDGVVEVRPEPAEAPDACVEADPATLFRIVSRELDIATAAEQGLVRIEGELADAERFFSLFSFEPRRPAAAVAI
jgi:DNA-binding HxlR family transcriptional regulator